MKTSIDSKPKGVRNKIPLLAVAVVVGLGAIAGLVWAGMSVYKSSRTNYAEEVARPLEEGLAKVGGVKRCTTGDAGRGFDNKAPWHSAYYQFNVGKDEAIKIVNEVATSNGYTLAHADSPYDSIEWFSDNSSKAHSFPEVEQGKIQLGMNTYSDTAQHPLECLDGPALLGDSTHTAVSLNVGLPNLRR